MAVIRISAKTNLLITTKSILSRLHRYKYAEVQALGRFSVHRAETAICRAAAMLEMENFKLVYRYTVIEPDTDGNEKPGIRFFLNVVQELSSQPGPEGLPTGSDIRVPTGPFDGKPMAVFPSSASG